ncbi:cytochrome c3 family protein [Nitrosophilus alvini]|uniref:cytochrome c3 family protein n=1 Tax=Nitrosophilus alvini TaxID=2714855 RepID=UPI00190B0A3E|nr:cytochrome c3 family protein [Nitrosophilus alvini]
MRKEKIITKLALCILLFFSFEVLLFAQTNNNNQDENGIIVSLIKKAKYDPIDILQPADKGVYEEEYISVAVKIYDKKIDKIIIYTSQNERVEIKIEKDKDTYCQTFNFPFGEHSVKVVAYINGEKKARKKIHFYRKAFLSKFYKIVPEGYEKKFFHNGEFDKMCSSCHDMSVNEEEGVAFYDVTESNCFVCHKSLIYKKFAHAPTVNFVCLPCHNGKIGAKNRQYKGKSKFLYPDPVGNTCFKCHKRNHKIWSSKKVKHDPVGAGKCNKCHNPHSSDVNKNFLRKSVWKLCTTCHADKSSKRKYISLFKTRYKNGEEIEKRFITGDFNCISCHNPHVSDRKFLLREKFANMRNVCLDLASSGGRW